MNINKLQIQNITNLSSELDAEYFNEEFFLFLLENRKVRFLFKWINDFPSFHKALQ